MGVSRGDTLIVVHGDFGRPRPAVVVQTDSLGEDTTTVLVCPITSQLTERLPIRPVIEPSTANGLRARSQIITDKMLANQRSGIRSSLGRLEASAIEHLDRALMVALSLGH